MFAHLVQKQWLPTIIHCLYDYGTLRTDDFDDMTLRTRHWGRHWGQTTLRTGDYEDKIILKLSTKSKLAKFSKFSKIVKNIEYILPTLEGWIFYWILEVKGPSGPQLLVCGPSGLLDFVLCALRALRPCDPRRCVHDADVHDPCIHDVMYASMMQVSMMHVSMMHVSMMQMSMIHVSMMWCMHPWCIYPWCMYQWYDAFIHNMMHVSMILDPDTCMYDDAYIYPDTLDYDAHMNDAFIRDP